ncbi:S-layer homology domain-containing protein [Paenibacillus sp. P13VS]|uniref:S-layer homology domain-containing protein n=1 Tax=Paenibacillus sp. P13VS TaxID=2697367 RepID=UPI00187B148D|nr:S-layer homology domain-containing protein [Paenibacillus sp. P13VS]MBE7680116.1 cellulase family glycosylhydrolase [Paenibacillus sp. P13VS]
MYKIAQAKRITSLLVAFMLLFGSIMPGGRYWGAVEVQAEKANLIINGNFESGDLSGWDTNGSSKFVVTEAEKYSGTFGLQISGPQNWNGIQYTTEVEPNTDYSLSFYGKGAGGAAYKIISGADEATILEQYTFTESDWTLYKADFNSGKHTLVKLYISDTIETAYYDDIVLSQADRGAEDLGSKQELSQLDSATSVKSTVTNGGFETGDISNWNTGGSTKFTVTNAVYRNGQYALQIEATSQDYTGIKNTVAVEPDTDYVLTFYAKGAGGSYFKVLSAADELTIKESQTSASTNWKKVSLPFNSGMHSSIIIYVSDMVGTAYFDDFAVSPAAAPDVPGASTVMIAGDAKVTSTLTGSYTYTHPSNVEEAHSIYTWLMSDTVDGEYTKIPGSYTLNTYKLTDAHIGKFIKFQVTPLDNEGVRGAAVQSEAIGPIAKVGARHELVYKISLAKQMLEESKQGTGIGQYPESAWNAMVKAIEEAETLANEAKVEEEVLLNEKSNLAAAMNSFDKARITKPSPLKNFITTNGDKIMDGDRELRFISYNYPGALFNEDEAGGIMPTAFEQEDAIRTIQQSGGKVFRAYSLTVKQPDQADDTVRHIVGPGVLNEEAFLSMDKLLELANQYGVRVIIPFIDHWSWPPGGVSDFAAFRGITDTDATRKAFYTDEQLRDDFKLTMDKILNRVNTLTGVRYKDDPAILAWETGNELMVAPDWEADIAAHYKSINENQLFVAGNLIEYPSGSSSHGYKNVTTEALTDPNYDIVKSHYYSGNYVARTKADKALAGNKKPFIVGEFGFKPTQEVEAMLDEVIDSGASGAMIWSLRPHSMNGGFIRHSEYDPGDGIVYSAYHWPGMPSGDYQDETNVMRVVREKAYAIDGLTVPQLPLPEPAPQLLATDSISKLSWRGSTGASSYIVERAEQALGPWSIVGDQVLDDVQPGENMFSDRTAETGKSYYYRVKGVNSSGESEYSNVIGPIVTKHLLIDVMEDQSKQYYTDKESIVYRMPGSVLSFKIRASSEAFSFYLSKDGIQYTKITPDWDGKSYHFSNVQLPDADHLKIRFPNGNPEAGQLLNVQIEYRGDGSLLTPVQPLITSGVISDEMENLSNMSQHSDNVAFDHTSAELAGGDASRLVRTDEEEAYIVYRSVADMNSIKLETYQPEQAVDNDLFELYGSADGIKYAELTAEIRSLGGQWYKTNYGISDLPTGIKFVKIVYPSGVAGIQFPQISRLQIGVGDGSVSFPAVAPASIIDNGEYYGGESQLVDRAYNVDPAGGEVSLALDQNIKIAGNYGLKTTFQMGEKSFVSITKELSQADRSTFDTLQFWVKPDGDNRNLTVQLGTEDGQIWSKDTVISGTKAVYVNLPIGNSIDMTKLSTFKLIVRKGEGSAEGSITLDDIQFVQTRIIDDFDSYKNESEFTQRYNKTNPSGNLSLSLDRDMKVSGQHSMQMDYNFRADGYGGVITSLPHLDWSDYDKIRLWVQPNGSLISLTVQVRMGSGVYMEARVELDGGTEGKFIDIPFSEFEYPAWYGGNSGTLDPRDMTEFNLYLGQIADTTSSTGSIFIDQIELVKKAVPVSGMTLNKTELKLKKGNMERLTAAIVPADATNRVVAWSSSNPAVAKVGGDGMVSALSVGKTEITALTEDGGFTAKAVVTVMESSDPHNQSSGQVPTGEPGSSDELDEHSQGGVIKIPAKAGEEGVAVAKISEAELKKAIDLALSQGISIQVIPTAGASKVSLVLPVQHFLHREDMKEIKVDLGLAAVSIPRSLLESQGGADVSEIVLTVISTLRPELRNNGAMSIPGPMLDFTFTVDGKQIHTFDGEEIVFSIPYSASDNIHTNQIVVVNMNGTGKLHVVKNGKYNLNTGKVDFKASDFSQYAAAYKIVSFTDVSGVTWAVDAINMLAARDIIQGYGKGLFKPDNSLTRAEFMHMLINALDLYDETAVSSFNDVQPGVWYTRSIATAEKLGITNGIGGTEFGVKDRITRQDAAVMLNRAMASMKIEGGQQQTKELADEAEISGYAIEAVHAAEQAGLIMGLPKGTFMPKATVTRAEAAVMTYRLFIKL